MDEQERFPTGWVSVSGELPKEGEFVLVYTKRKNFYNAAYVTNADDETKWALQEGGWIRVQDVTHWMPLPSAPSSVAEQPQLNPNWRSVSDCPKCGEFMGHGHVCNPVPSGTQDEPPLHPIEIRISIGGEDWHYVISRLKEYLWDVERNGVLRTQMTGGAGGSASVTVSHRDVTKEQFRKELQEWHERQ